MLTLRLYVPGFGRVLGKLFAKSQNEHQATVKDMVRKRINKTEYDHRGDFMDHIMRAKTAQAELTDAELAANADLLMIAGSETTATLLAGVTYLLLSNPFKLHRVITEVRSAFSTAESITFATATSRLPYMLACLTEALRLYPPVPIVIFRETLPTQPAGTLISGHTVPPNTKVGVPQLAAYHSSRNFHRPTSFLPERWLPAATQDATSEFYADRRDVHRPFSTGPRDCIGRNLAFHEMRIIMARLLWEFDLALEDEEEMNGGWRDQKVRIFWDKKPLMVRLKKRRDV